MGDSDAQLDSSDSGCPSGSAEFRLLISIYIIMFLAVWTARIQYNGNISHVLAL
jgi:hypothetical protein